MGAACQSASLVEELKYNGAPLLLMDEIGSDEMFSDRAPKQTFLFDSRELRVYNLREQLQYSMTKAGKILDASGIPVVQLNKEIGADTQTVYVACTGHGFKDRKLAVHSSNVRQTFIVDVHHVEQTELKRKESEQSITRKETDTPREDRNIKKDPLLLDGPAPLQLEYVGGSFAPSCCNCFAGTKRKKVYATISRPPDEMCVWFQPEGSPPTVIALYSKSIAQVYRDRFADTPSVTMDSMFGLRIAPRVEQLMVFTLMFMHYKMRSRDPWG